MSVIGLSLASFRRACATHDRHYTTHGPVYGIGMSHFDMERLGFDEGEELWAGVTITCDGGTTGNFRLICGGDHGEASEARAVAEELSVHSHHYARAA